MTFWVIPKWFGLSLLSTELFHLPPGPSQFCRREPFCAQQGDVQERKVRAIDPHLYVVQRKLVWFRTICRWFGHCVLCWSPLLFNNRSTKKLNPHT